LGPALLVSMAFLAPEFWKLEHANQGRRFSSQEQRAGAPVASGVARRTFQHKNSSCAFASLVSPSVMALRAAPWSLLSREIP
jgi:hypothetical protein